MSFNISSIIIEVEFHPTHLFKLEVRNSHLA